MSYPFLSDSENRELVLRIKRARRDEDGRYMKAKTEAHQDHVTRGLVSSSVHITVMCAIEKEHVKRLFEIYVEELFTIVREKDIEPNTQDVDTIRKVLSQAMEGRGTAFAEEMERHVVGLGNAGTQTIKQCAQDVDQVLEDLLGEILIRVNTLKREKDRERRERKRKWTDRLLVAIIGIIAGVIGTLVTQWVTSTYFAQ